MSPPPPPLVACRFRGLCSCYLVGSCELLPLCAPAQSIIAHLPSLCRFFLSACAILLSCLFCRFPICCSPRPVYCFILQKCCSLSINLCVPLPFPRLCCGPQNFSQPLPHSTTHCIVFWCVFRITKPPNHLTSSQRECDPVHLSSQWIWFDIFRDQSRKHFGFRQKRMGRTKHAVEAK